MSSQAVKPSTDFERFLAPITDEQPCGVSLRYEGTYDRIEQLRREDNPNLPRGIWQTELKRADWPTVEAICAEALETRSKDLQLAAWLLQAWIHLYSFKGAARGVALMNALCEKFWDGMFPAIENGDMEFRLAPIRWMNEKLAIELKLLPVTNPGSDDVRPYCWADWEPLLRATATTGEQSNATSVAGFQQSLQMTSREWLVATNRDVHEAISACATFDRLIDEKAGNLAPGTLQFRAVLEEVASLLNDVLSRTNIGTIVPVLGPGDEEGSESEPTDTALAVSTEEPVVNTIRTRAEAYRMLEAAAEFLQRTEPHSPTPYLIRRAVSWGKMSFNELLPELIRNGSEMSELLRLLQVDGNAPNKPKS